MGAKFTRKHEPQKKLDRHQVLALKGVKGNFLNSQLSTAIYMMMRSLGHLPLRGDASDDQKQAAAQLKSVQTFGGGFGDTIGFGKTHETPSWDWHGTFSMHCPHHLRSAIVPTSSLCLPVLSASNGLQLSASRFRASILSSRLGTVSRTSGI